MAVFVAVVVAESIMLAPTALPDQGRFGSIVQSLRTLPDLLAIGLFYTFVFALPGFLIAIATAWACGWNRWLDFAISGAVNAVFSLVLFSTWLNGSLGDFAGMTLYCVPGGFAGGIAYWLVTNWRRGEGKA